MEQIQFEEVKDNAEVKPLSTEKVCNTKKCSNAKMFLYGILVVLGITLVAIIGIVLYRVYVKTSMDKFTVTTANILRLPVMKVNSERILYFDYVQDMKAIEKLVAFDIASQGGAGLTAQEMSDQVLWRLVNNVLVKEAAAKYGVKIEQTDIDTLKANLMQQFTDTAELEKEISQRYGWTFAQYEEKVIKNFILQQKVGEIISTDQKAREEVRVRAQAVLDQVKGGADFATLASQYGEDGTKANGGDLGWFGEGDMVPTFEAATFVLKKGEITQELVETEYGYHIIKLDDQKIEKVKNDAGKTVDTKKVSARHILFRFPSADTFLNDSAKAAYIRLFIKTNNPFADLNK